MKTYLLLALFIIWSEQLVAQRSSQPSSLAKPAFETNSVAVFSPPSWLNETILWKAAKSVEDQLEWDIRKIKVYWHKDNKEFQRFHGLGPSVRAVAVKKDETVHLGPLVNKENFSEVFKHELAHIIMFQKYKQAIPPWLEEGLANFVSRDSNIDYKFLAKKTALPITSLTHPFGKNADSVYHYQASTAVMKMIAEKCSVTDLLQLSVGKKLESYLKTYCQIDDLDASFRSWINQKARGGGEKKKKYWWSQ